MLLEAAKRLKQVQVNRGRVTGQTRGDYGSAFEPMC